MSKNEKRATSKNTGLGIQLQLCQFLVHPEVQKHIIQTTNMRISEMLTTCRSTDLRISEMLTTLSLQIFCRNSGSNDYKRHLVANIYCFIANICCVFVSICNLDAFYCKSFTTKATAERQIMCISEYAISTNLPTLLSIDALSTSPAEGIKLLAESETESFGRKENWIKAWLSRSKIRPKMMMNCQLQS